MRQVDGWAAKQPGGRLEPWDFERRDLLGEDVALRILYRGVCASDLHAVRGGASEDFPLVPGHEIVGEVTDVRDQVTRFAAGDFVAVGNIVDSCRLCPPCRAGQENYCEKFPTTTYGGIDRHDGSSTEGGYSSQYVANQTLRLSLSRGIGPRRCGPTAVRRITTYSPLRHWGVGPGTTVGISGSAGWATWR